MGSDYIPDSPADSHHMDANWGRSVSASARRNRVRVGAGLVIRKTINGVVISAKSKSPKVSPILSPMPFDASASDDKVSVLGGTIFALTCATTGTSPSLFVEDAEVDGTTGVLTLEVSVSYSLFSNRDNPEYTLSAEFVISDGEPDCTDNGLFVNIPSGFVGSSEGTTTGPTSGTEVLLPLSPSGSDPACVFRIPLADVEVESGKVKSVTQRRHGDIGLPLAINWRIPFTSEGE